MGHKKVCFACKKAFSIYLNHSEQINLICPECGKQASILSKEFRPPSKNEIQKWKVVEFLKDNGFTYNHIYDSNKLVKYPETMHDAAEFVVKYKR